MHACVVEWYRVHMAGGSLMHCCFQVLDVLFDTRQDSFSSSAPPRCRDADSAGVECTDVAFSPSGDFLASCHRNGRTVILRTSLFARRLVLTPCNQPGKSALLSQAPSMPSGHGVHHLFALPTTALRVRVWDVDAPGPADDHGHEDPSAWPAAYMLMVDGERHVGLYRVRRRPDESHMAKVAHDMQNSDGFTDDGESPERMSHFDALRAALKVRRWLCGGC